MKKAPIARDARTNNKAAILADLKGVDKQLAETILDEVVERYIAEAIAAQSVIILIFLFSDSLVITWDDIGELAS